METFDSSRNRDRSVDPDVADAGSPHDDLYAGCEPVAVIGLACRFPGAPNSDAYWRNLVGGVESSRRFSRDELRAAGVDPATAADPNYVNVAAVLEDVEAFDASLFGYSRQEAEILDPQQRLFLQIVWHSLEHAGYAPRQVPHKTGVFGTARMSTYPGRERIARGVSSASGLQALLGNDKDYLATRVAYKLDLKGPALTIQTACSSSLVTVHMACESLRAGECDMAVAGGSAVSFPHAVGYLYQPGMIFSPDGRCRPFDANANGTYGGHGVGAVTLRRLEDALREGDPILAVLRGSAINNDGSLKVGFTAPSVGGQREVIREAMAMADVSADDIGMIEAHGTATSLGDPIEIEALAAALAERRAQAAPVWVGSVKGNFGHLDTAAGVASLIKAVLSVHHGAIPPSLGFETPNPALKLETTPFAIAAQRQEWTQPVRTAGVSSFGLGGTNCHVIVQSAPARADATRQSALGSLFVSAATQEGLRRLAGDYAARLRGGVEPTALAETALAGREHGLGARLAVRLCEAAPAALEAFATGTTDPLVSTGEGRGRLLWLFSGQGTQWTGMGQWLHGASKPFAKTLDDCCDLVAPHLDLPLRDVMFGRHPDALADMSYAQPAIMTFQLAMAASWRDLGLEPAAVLGHSVGEYAAAVVTGLLPVETMLPLVVERGRLMQAHGAGGAMLAAFADEATLRPLIDACGLDVAAYNDERHLVVSGRVAGIDKLSRDLDARDIRHSRLAVSGAAHSELLDPMLDAFARAAERVESGAQSDASDIVYVSGLFGRVGDPGEIRTGEYWRRHVREPVRYSQALAQALADPETFGLELGADAPLTGIGRRAMPQRRWIASAKQQEPPEETLEAAYRQLYAAGQDLPWKRIWPGIGRKCHAPLYPFATDLYTCAPTVEPKTAQSPAGGGFDGVLDAGRKVATTAASTLDLPRLRALYDCVVPLHAIFVDKMVRRCVGDRIDAGVSAIDILRGGRLLPRYWQLLARLLKSCVEDGYYRADGELIASAHAIPHGRSAELVDELRGYCEGLDAIPETVARAGDALASMMRGDVDPVSVIFPSSASKGVEVLYQDFSFGRYFNQIAAGVVAGAMRERAGRRARAFDILEVGGGTGGTTAWLLPELQGQPNVAYDFTDISPIFTRRAAEKFAGYDFVTYREFDLERDPEPQGFAAAGYDLIVAANVIHATQHVGRTLRRLRGLLKPGGRLVMREITRPMRLFDFVFGPLVAPLLDLPERGGELFLDTERWDTNCREAGFETVEWLPEDGSATSRISEHVIVAGTAGVTVAGRVGEDTGDAMLGRAIGPGTYIADWSDCADDAAWQRRLEESARALAHRHDAKVPEWHAPPRPSLDLSEVRLTWCPGLFGAAQLDVEALSDNGDWRLLARGKPAATDPARALAPLPAAAPSTHYRWKWRAAKTVETKTIWAARGATHEQVEAWGRAGVRIDEDSQALLLVPGDADPTSLAAGLLSAFKMPMSEIPLTDRLVVLTRNAWGRDDRALVDPGQRAIWGLLRVAAVEQPSAFIGAVDLPVDADPNDLERGLAAIEAGERWVSVRDGEALAQELVEDPTMQPAMPPKALAASGWHVITGGFGGLGRVSAAWLVEQGAGKIAILAPRASDEARAWQTELQTETGAIVRWLACDVADPDALRSSLGTLDSEGGIAGVLHAAGILDDAPLGELDAIRLSHVFAVKIGAADTILTHLTKTDRHGYLVLYSSAAAALGAPGQGAHAFACAYLDGLADKARASGSAVASIAWGAWGEIGGASAPDMRQRLATSGMGCLTTAEGLWHLEQAMLGVSACRLAMRLDTARIDERRLLFAQMPKRSTPTTRKASLTSPVDSASKAPLLSGDPAEDSTVLQEWLTRHVAGQLRLDSAMVLDVDRDLLQLGLDSLLFLELSADVERTFGVRLDAKRAYRAMTIAGLSGLILSDRGRPHDVPSNEPSSQDATASDPASRFEPFPLTPIQHAYWLGRTDLLAFGGIACHVVFEWDKHVADCDPQALETAWNAVIRRHDMLRATIASDGLQRVAEDVPTYRFTRNDLRGLPAAEVDARLDAVRERLSREVTPADRWPLFEVAISRRDDGAYRLHMKLDLLLFDVQSFKVLFDDLASAFAGGELAPLEFTFRDYIMQQRRERERPAWRAAWRYWLDAIETLPPAPDLALAARDVVAQPKVVTRQGRLDKADWSKLKARWQAWGVTPSAALLTLFALVLERASRRPDFTLNLTFFNRQPIHPDVSQLIGDFTSVLLVEFAPATDYSLRKLMEATQERLWGHLANSSVNGVDVLRELGRRRGTGGKPLMPVVFTSMLGMTLDGLSIDRAMTRLLGTPVNVFTQTPQVWIDHQAMEEDGGLLFHWYCMDEVLAPGLVPTLFADYDRLLQRLAAQPDTDGLAAILPPRRPHPTAAGPNVDWRDLEAVLRTYPGVDGALVEASVDGETPVAWLRVDPHHPAGGSAVAFDPAALPVLDPETSADVERVWHHLEARALRGLWRTLRNYGLFAAGDGRVTHRDAYERIGVAPANRRLLRQWLDNLAARGVLKRDGDGFVPTGTEPVQPDDVPESDLPDWARKLVRFVDGNIEAHDALLRGERSALEIFFDTHADAARVLYGTHPVITCLHEAAAAAVRQFAEGRDHLRVLEVGAGFGVTAGALLPVLREHIESYAFTDVSTLFLDDARKLFADEPAMRYALFDINEAPDFAAHPDEGYDLIVAVNVLHDAKHISRSLDRLRSLMRTDGTLLVLEATERDSAFQLATIGFIEGLNGYEDIRAEDDKPMLAADQWRRMLDDSGYAVDLTWPAEEHGNWRQTLFIAHATRGVRPRLVGMQEHLHEVRDGADIALDVRLCTGLPGGEKEKQSHEESASPMPSAGERSPEVEAVVGDVWSGLLSRGIDATSDFFVSGGDSLIATRMIAALNKRGFPNASLRHIFEHSRLPDFCAAIAAAGARPRERIQTLASGRDATRMFAFHGSDGGIEPYLPLARALDCVVHGIAADTTMSAPSLAMLVRRYVAAIRQEAPRGPYDLLGWSYGAFLAAEAAGQLRKAGETVQILLLDPVHRDDLGYNDRAGLLRLMCDGRIKVNLPADFDDLDATHQLRAFLECMAAADAWPGPANPEAAEVEIDRIDDLLGLSKTASRAVIEAPCLWLTAKKRPAHWRPAETEWAARLPFATRDEVDTDHWQLVLDPTTCEDIADRWRSWRARSSMEQRA